MYFINKQCFLTFRCFNQWYCSIKWNILASNPTWFFCVHSSGTYKEKLYKNNFFHIQYMFVYMFVRRKMNYICLDCLNLIVLTSIHVKFMRPIFFCMHKVVPLFCSVELFSHSDGCTWRKGIVTRAHKQVRFPSVIYGDSSSVVYLGTMRLPW